jgi:integrase
VSFIKPHKAVSKCTISRWIKIWMRKAGIDMTVFTPHSTRGASTSPMERPGIPLKTIMQSAGWTNEHTFAGYFYSRPLE